jgi:hypothetical protein
MCFSDYAERTKPDQQWFDSGKRGASAGISRMRWICLTRIERLVHVHVWSHFANSTCIHRPRCRRELVDAVYSPITGQAIRDHDSLGGCVHHACSREELS